MGRKNKSKKISNAEDRFNELVDTKNATDISLENISLSIGKVKILDSTSLKLSYGRKYGLVGINGVGKSTLLRAMYNRTLDDMPNIDMFYVEQENPASDVETVYETVISSSSKRSELLQMQYALEKKMENDDDVDMELYNRVIDELSAIGADQDEAKVNKILRGMGFEEDEIHKPTISFSGGWRMRISIAKALFLEPTLLLLDEPTNHLDLNAVLWLSNYLSSWKNTVFVVSHDKDFLNEVCTDIVHITEKKLYYYKGDYNMFKSMESQLLKKRNDDWTSFEKRIKHMQKKGTTKKEIMEYTKKHGCERPPKPYRVRINFPEVGDIGIPVLEVRHVDFSYSNKKIFSNLDFGIDLNSRITIVGRNGTGKSTFIKLLAKELKPSAGEIYYNHKMRVGYFHQHNIEHLPLEQSAVDYLKSLDNELIDQDARKYLGGIGLEGSLHLKPIKVLSGGQKSRVALAGIFVIRPHVVLLDEPTNHLDIETIESLIDAVNNFSGAVVMVTHNVDLITDTRCALWELDQGELKETTFVEYKNKLLFELE